MIGEWKETTIGEQVTLQRGFDITKSVQKPGAVPVISTAGVLSYHDTAKCKSPGVIVGRKGNSIGRCHYASEDYWPHDTTLWVKDFKGNDPKFIYYFFTQLFDLLQSLDVGSANPTLNRNHVHPISTIWPPLPEQKAIAHILGSLDDKIELNRRMNTTLEGLAQALFQSWFVDFDPVVDNALAAGNPIPDELTDRAAVRRQALDNGTANREAAQHFPASFQFTEELGWIPEGWEVIPFDKIAKLDTTSVKPFQEPETEWEHYSIPSFDSSGLPVWEQGSEIKSNKYQIKEGAILSSKLNPETERTWWPFLIKHEVAICSTEFMQFVPVNLEEQTYIYSLIRSEPFQKNIRERVTGSTGSRQRAQPKQIAIIEILDCGVQLREDFVQQALPLFQLIQNNTLESLSLSKLRDTLLPQLISGELRIPDAAKLAEAALA